MFKYAERAKEYNKNRKEEAILSKIAYIFTTGAAGRIARQGKQPLISAPFLEIEDQIIQMAERVPEQNTRNGAGGDIYRRSMTLDKKLK